jgi:hypothetical protein
MIFCCKNLKSVLFSLSHTEKTSKIFFEPINAWGLLINDVTRLSGTEMIWWDIGWT